MLDEASPLCGDQGRCYLAAGHYPFSLHEDATTRWTAKFPAKTNIYETTTAPFHVKQRTRARHRA